ncbi:MAG: hypothetical protein AB4372_07165 [Xenococcus sp. (in: cyanobacteria)]
MNKLLFSFFSIICTLNLIATSAIAREEPYGGRCLYIDKEKEEQQFKRCQVTIQQGNLAVKFDEEKYQEDDKTIAVKSIYEIASGAYATKLLSDSGSLVSGILLGPISLVGRIVRPNQDFQQYILHYTDQGKKTATVLNINRSDIAEFQQELSLVTGKLIIFREGQTRTTIDVGPDIEDIN